MRSKRQIVCRDAVGRSGSVFVEAAGRDRIVMVAPAGAVAVLSDANTAELCEALSAARKENQR